MVWALGSLGLRGFRALKGFRRQGFAGHGGLGLRELAKAWGVDGKIQT